MIGKEVNHYRIVSRLGKGGMGEVFAAEDTKLGRKIALKVLPAEMASDPERRARFEREAKAVASLNHPNIVTIHSVEEAEGLHFLTMELVDGQPLSALIPPHGLPLNELLERGIALADAVSAAHKLGITHRDLKPDNIMIGADGRLKVLDFGLAKLQESSTGATGGTLLPTQSVTAEGKILGTVSYMSPEQAEGKPVDARSDVFSMGIILYQMATGRRPFQGDTPISTLSAILKETPQSITDLNLSLPRHLGRVVGYCLAKNPDRRYQSSLELRRELEGLREESQSGELTMPDGLVAPAKPASGSKWIGLGLAAVAIVVVALVATRFLPGGKPSGTAPPSSAANMQMVRLTTSGHGAEGAISPDGNYVAFVEREDAGHSLWVSHVSTGSRVQIAAPTLDFFMWDPTFSPQSDYIYYCGIERGAGVAALYRVPVLGGNSRKIADGVGERISFSPDGERFVFTREEPGQSALVVSSLDGSDAKVIATRIFPSDFDDPSWSPDGTTIAVAASTLAGGIQANIVLVPSEGGAERNLLDQPWNNVGEVAWFSDGSGLVFDGNERMEFFVSQLWEVSYPGGETRRITNDLNMYSGITVDAAGKNLATTLAEFSADLWIVEADDSIDPVQLTRTSSQIEGLGLDWTTDGRVVFATAGGGRLDIEIMGANGDNRKRITTDAGLNATPSVTPDGEWLVFLSTRAETINIWKSNLDGGDAVQLTSGELDDQPSLSHDGRWVLFVGGDGRNVMRVSIEGGEPVPLNDRHSQNPVASPDGQLVAARTWDADAKRWAIDIFPFDGGEPIQRMDIQGEEYKWAPDGKSLTVSTDRAGLDNLFAHPLDGSAPRQLTDLEESVIADFAWSPDGKRILITRGKFESDVVLLRDFR